jgi:hypothetical protein
MKGEAAHLTPSRRIASLVKSWIFLCFFFWVSSPLRKKKIFDFTNSNWNWKSIGYLQFLECMQPLSVLLSIWNTIQITLTRADQRLRFLFEQYQWLRYFDRQMKSTCWWAFNLVHLIGLVSCIQITFCWFLNWSIWVGLSKICFVNDDNA